MVFPLSLPHPLRLGPRRAGRALASIALIAGLGACQTNSAVVPETALVASATELDWGDTREIYVNAALEWQSTGLIVAADNAYQVTATGTWSIGGICGVTDADGTGVSPLCSADHLQIGASGSALIGRIGRDGQVFKVGRGLLLKPTTSGEFFLRSYDMIPFDNTGSLHVRIAHADAAGGKEKPPRHHDPL